MHNRPYLDGGRRGVRSTRGSVPKRTRRHVKDASRGAFVYMNTAAALAGGTVVEGNRARRRHSNAAREGIQIVYESWRATGRRFCELLPRLDAWCVDVDSPPFIIAGSRDARCTTTC